MADLGETPEQRLEQEVVSWSDAVYDEAERELADSREIRLTSKLIDYISGNQWNAKSRYGRSRPTVNRLFRQFVEMAGLLTDIEPDFQVKFHNEDKQWQALQTLMNEMIVMWAQVSDFESELTQSVMWALLHTGYAKIQWNSSLNNGMGDNEFMPLGPINVMSIGSGHKLQSDECVIARWPATIEAMVRDFGKVAEGVVPDLETGGPAGEATRPGKISEAKWAALNPQLKRLLGKQSPTGLMSKKSRYPKAMIKQFCFRDRSINTGSETKWVGDERYNWSYQVEPGMPWYPRGRFLIVAGGKVLQDGPNPYWHAQFPFAKLRLIRVPWSPNGISPLDPIAMMSDIVNRINGGIMDMIRAAIEPRIVAPKAAFAQCVWDWMDPGAPGAKMQYNNNTPREPSSPKPPELPACVLQMKQDIEKEQDMSSGASAIQQSLQKKQVPGGDSLEMIMNSRSIPIRFMGRGLSSFLTEVGSQVAANNMQFSTSKSRIKKFGVKGLTDFDFEPIFGQFLSHGMTGEDLVKQMVFSIRKGSLLNIEKQDEVQVAFGMVKLGVLSRKALYRKLGIPKSEQDRIEAELKEEAIEKIKLAQAAGAGQQHKPGHK